MARLRSETVREASLSMDPCHLFNEREDDGMILLPFALGAAGAKQLVNESSGRQWHAQGFACLQGIFQVLDMKVYFEAGFKVALGYFGSFHI